MNWQPLSKDWKLHHVDQWGNRRLICPDCGKVCHEHGARIHHTIMHTTDWKKKN